MTASNAAFYGVMACFQMTLNRVRRVYIPVIKLPSLNELSNIQSKWGGHIATLLPGFVSLASVCPISRTFGEKQTNISAFPPLKLQSTVVVERRTGSLQRHPTCSYILYALHTFLCRKLTTLVRRRYWLEIKRFNYMSATISIAMKWKWGLESQLKLYKL